MSATPHSFKPGRNLWLLAGTSFFTDVSSHMVLPLLPLFLVSVLRATPSIVGIVEGGAESFAALIKGFAGRWSDRSGHRRAFVTSGYGLSTLTRVLFVLATSWPLVLLARLTERIGKGLRSAPRDALILEEADPEWVGRSFGFQQAFDAAGALVGAILVWWLVAYFEYRQIFAIALGPAAIGVVLTLFLRERRRNATAAPAAASDADAGTVSMEPAPPRARFRDLPPALLRAIFACALFAFGQFGVAFFVLAASARGLGDRDTLAFYVLFNAAGTLVAWPAGRLSDTFGRKPLLLAGYALFASACAAMLLHATFAWVIAFALLGAGIAVTEAVQRALIADLAPRHLRATAMGAYYAAIALVALPGGWLAGRLWQAYTPDAAFLFGLSASSVAAWLLWRLPESHEARA